MAKVRHLLIGLASTTALYSGVAPALGLGDIALHSALSQPLSAEIELLDVADLTSADLHVRLAPAEIYQRAGVDRLYALNDLRFTPLLRGDKSVIRVVSSQPIREPYLNFIVEVQRPNGQLYREYTLLLDPPESSAYRSLAQPVAAVIQAAAQPAAQPRVSAPPRPAPAPTRLPESSAGKSYTVASGDSLWKIANQLSAGQRSPQALMNDIQALNPGAFIDGDINRLRAGAHLRLPNSAASVASAPAAPTPPAAEAPVQVASQAPVAAPSDAVLSIDPDEVPPPLPATPEQQAKLEQQLDSQLNETIQLQQSLAELGTQVQDLREQMGQRDKQIVALLAQLAARQAETPAPAEAPAPLLGATAAPSAASLSPGWLAALAALLGGTVVGLLALLWRRSRPQPAAATVAQPVAPVLPASPARARSSVAIPAAKPQAVVGVPQGQPLDVLQSANVYIAHGQFNEAASTLRQGLLEQPQRGDLGLRLLEVLALQGDGPGFLALEEQVRNTGFSPVRIDQIKSQYSHLFTKAPAGLLDDAVLELGEQAEGSQVDLGQLNLDDIALDADWDQVSPFDASAGNSCAATPAPVSSAANSEVFAPIGHRDARSPFAESMLVEETHHDSWSGETLELDLPELDAMPQDGADVSSKLSAAINHIEQGSLVSAGEILRQVLSEGDESQQQQARQLLQNIS